MRGFFLRYGFERAKRIEPLVSSLLGCRVDTIIRGRQHRTAIAGLSFGKRIVMSDKDRSPGLERRTFLSGAALGGAALSGAAMASMTSMFAPGAALGQRRLRLRRPAQQPSPPARPNVCWAAPSTTLMQSRQGRLCSSTDTRVMISSERSGGRGCARFPCLWQTQACVVRRTSSWNGWGKSLNRSAQISRTVCASDQYFTEANAVRAYHLARFAAFGKYIPPSTSMIMERVLGGQSNMTKLAHRGDAGTRNGPSQGSIPRTLPSLPSRDMRPRW